MITSTSNPQIKQVIQLSKKPRLRKEQGLFVVEGSKMCQEAPDGRIQKVFVSSHFIEKEEHRELLQKKGLKEGDGRLELVDDRVFKALSDTMTPQGILCVMRQREYKLEDLLKGTPLLLILEDLQDPGNLGTILRTGEGAGVTGVIMSPNTVDIYNPKTIRSTMGSIYRIPFLYTDSLDDTLLQLGKKEILSYAAHLQGEKDYDQESYVGGTAFLIGNEGNGLTDGLAAKADRWIKIPMSGQVESLNAAMASGILCYEAARQRRRG